MRIAIIANELLKSELVSQGTGEALDIEWLSTPGELFGFEVVIDLLFENNSARIKQLNSYPLICIVNSVSDTCEELGENFIRINAWPGFLKGKVIEAATCDEKIKVVTEQVFAHFNKTVEWLPDQKGFITPRVISMIINEAYIALEDGVSSREDIDTAMRSGVNYPHGPFEWSKLIGLEKIGDLLKKLSETESRYMPSSLLMKEAGME